MALVVYHARRGNAAILDLASLGYLGAEEMSDDIVKRLRGCGNQIGTSGPYDALKEWHPCRLCQEAADEIERLRAERDAALPPSVPLLHSMARGQ